MSWTEKQQKVYIDCCQVNVRCHGCIAVASAAGPLGAHEQLPSVEDIEAIRQMGYPEAALELSHQILPSILVIMPNFGLAAQELGNLLLQQSQIYETLGDASQANTTRLIGGFVRSVASSFSSGS